MFTGLQSEHCRVKNGICLTATYAQLGSRCCQCIFKSFCNSERNIACVDTTMLEELSTRMSMSAWAGHNFGSAQLHHHLSIGLIAETAANHVNLTFKVKLFACDSERRAPLPSTGTCDEAPCTCLRVEVSLG
ncbi:MAG: hypothetical protein BGP07_02035 [Rhizobiales bacterium 63-22]|nr:MAG: hypothetical protein BGP07_02035 [Rhizobiales bacterium 63-22]